jgi:hypothetical protein
MVRFSAQLRFQRFLTPCALSALPLFSNLSSLLPLGKPGEMSFGVTLLPVNNCCTARIEEMGLHRNRRQSVVA